MHIDDEITNYSNIEYANKIIADSANPDAALAQHAIETIRTVIPDILNGEYYSNWSLSLVYSADVQTTKKLKKQTKTFGVNKL